MIRLYYCYNNNIILYHKLRNFNKNRYDIYRYLSNDKESNNNNKNQPMKPLRLERIISNRGIGSRSEVNKLISSGKVRINNKIERVSSKRFSPDIIIEIDGLLSNKISTIVKYNKPIGIHSTVGDPMNRPNLQNLYNNHSIMKSFHPIGRLDCDTCGLLLFSSSGDLTQYLSNPQSNIEREYQAIVLGEVDYDQLKEKLYNGVQTTIGKFSLNLIHSELFNFDDTFINININDFDRSKTYSIVNVSTCEGKYRMVRRVLHNAGHSVIYLKRIRYGQIYLSDLQDNHIEECNQNEIEWINSLKF